MPNKRTGSGFSGKSAPKSKGSGSHAGTNPMKTANWPGAPGKKRPSHPKGVGKVIPQSVKQDY